MRLLTVSSAATAFFVLTFSPALANGRGGQSSHGKPHTTTSTKTRGPSVTTHAAPTKHAAPTTAHSAPTPKHAAPTTTAPTKTHGNPHKTTTTSTTTTGTMSGTAAGSNTTRLNPIARKISSKPQQAAKIEAMLPRGMTLNTASRGFKNQGQFIAALQASNKHNIPFRQLKAAMLGRNGAAPMSLGQAMHSLRSSTPTRTPTPTPTPTPAPTPTPTSGSR